MESLAVAGTVGVGEESILVFTAVKAGVRNVSVDGVVLAWDRVVNEGLDLFGGTVLSSSKLFQGIPNFGDLRNLFKNTRVYFSADNCDKMKFLQRWQPQELIARKERQSWSAGSLNWKELPQFNEALRTRNRYWFLACGQPLYAFLLPTRILWSKYSVHTCWFSHCAFLL